MDPSENTQNRSIKEDDRTVKLLSFGPPTLTTEKKLKHIIVGQS